MSFPFLLKKKQKRDIKDGTEKYLNLGEIQDCIGNNNLI